MMWHPGYWAERRPEHPALIMGERVLSYRQLDERSKAISASWRANGVQAGDTVALFMGNGPDFVCAAWAAQRSGLYYVAASSQLRAQELAYILGDSGACALLTDAAHVDVAADAVSSLTPPLRLRWTTGGAKTTCFELLDEVLAQPAPTFFKEEEGSDMLYTSGTTGRPKGVKRPLTQSPLGNDPRRVQRMQKLFGMDEKTVFFTPAPLYHAAPLRFAMTVLRMGGTVVITERFDAENALTLMSRHGVTHSQWVPTMFTRLLRLDPALRQAVDLPQHRVAIHSGAPCSVELKQAMIDWWGPILHEYYSGTESIGFTHCDSHQWLAHRGTVGCAVDCNIHIVGDNGEELPAGETGTVYFSGQAKLAYHNDAEKSRAAHHPKGWATMGDIGRVDMDGFLYLSDRRAFVIVSGGVNIYPREIEECLESHSAVAEAAVFGLPDPEFGESVQAIVQLHDTQPADFETAMALAAHVRERLARFKCPKHIDFIADMPRLSGGKLNKSALRDQYRASNQRGHAVSTPSSKE